MVAENEVRLVVQFLGEAGQDMPSEYTFGSEALKEAFLTGLYEGAEMGEFEILDETELDPNGEVRVIPGV